MLNAVLFVNVSSRKYIWLVKRLNICLWYRFHDPHENITNFIHCDQHPRKFSYMNSMTFRLNNVFFIKMNRDIKRKLHKLCIFRYGLSEILFVLLKKNSAAFLQRTNEIHFSLLCKSFCVMFFKVWDKLRLVGFGVGNTKRTLT